MGPKSLNTNPQNTSAYRADENKNILKGRTELFDQFKETWILSQNKTCLQFVCF